MTDGRGPIAGTTRFAEVVVNLDVSGEIASFHYRVPPTLDLRAGHLIEVPFGARRAQGIVLDVGHTTPVTETRDVTALLDPAPALRPHQIDLARWIADYYCCRLVDAVLLMLPAGIERRTHLIYAATTAEQRRLVALEDDPNDYEVVEYLRRHGPLRYERLRSGLGLRRLDQRLRRLEHERLVTRHWELEAPRARPRLVTRIVAAVAPDALHAAAANLRAPKQRTLLEWLAGQPLGGAYTYGEIEAATGASRAAVGALATRGLLQIERLESRRDPLAGRPLSEVAPPYLTGAQAAVWERLRVGIAAQDGTTFLLHGVTGSGKTELYLRAIDAALAQDRGAIVLVPEIALTPQTVQRLAGRFRGQVALWHSRLSAGEQYDEWRRIRDGEARVVVGSRSALFLPVRDPGVVVLDEEHEWTYKQEQTPRYHARDVARELARLTGAAVILGSATPDVATYHAATHGAGELIELHERVAGAPGPAERLPMPAVEVVDLRRELKEGNSGIFSRALHAALEGTLQKRSQAILFLNRRGSATSIVCRVCGASPRCRRCELPFAYHHDLSALVCHRCNRRRHGPLQCERCGSTSLHLLGLGTQSLVDETRRLFPDARILRWDQDATRGKHAHEAILERFSQHEADVLVGTQMIAKGLDLPNVTLVGVIHADTALFLPDLRAVERSFQLLTQVAGRAGRSRRGGRVVIQTYNPEHYAIRAASQHDYAAFYKWELAFRAEHGYPPFGQLARLVYRHTNDTRARAEAELAAADLRDELDRRGLADLDILGPAPCFHRRIRGRFRWQIILRGHQVQRILDQPWRRGWTIDVDPVSLL